VCTLLGSIPPFLLQAVKLLGAPNRIQVTRSYIDQVVAIMSARARLSLHLGTALYPTNSGEELNHEVGVFVAFCARHSIFNVAFSEIGELADELCILLIASHLQELPEPRRNAWIYDVISHSAEALRKVDRVTKANSADDLMRALLGMKGWPRLRTLAFPLFLERAGLSLKPFSACEIHCKLLSTLNIHAPVGQIKEKKGTVFSLHRMLDIVQFSFLGRRLSSSVAEQEPSLATPSWAF